MKKYSKFLAGCLAVAMIFTSSFSTSAAWNAYRIDEWGNLQWIYDEPPADNLFNSPATPEWAFIIASRCPTIEKYKAYLSENGYNFNDKEITILFEDYRNRWINGITVPVIFNSPKFIVTMADNFEIYPEKLAEFCKIADFKVKDGSYEFLFTTFDGMLKAYDYLINLTSNNKPMVSDISFDALIAEIAPEIDITGVVNQDVLTAYSSNEKIDLELDRLISQSKKDETFKIDLKMNLSVDKDGIEKRAKEMSDLSTDDGIIAYVDLKYQMTKEAILETLTPFIDTILTNEDEILLYTCDALSPDIILVLETSKERIYEIAESDKVSSVFVDWMMVPVSLENQIDSVNDRNYSIKDLILLAKFIAGKYTYADESVKNSVDLNSDGVLNGEDLLLIIKLLVGEISEQDLQKFTKSLDLMSNISAQEVIGKAVDDEFIGSMANFSVDLFKQSLTENENSLVSPTSVMLALSMTANGADGETLSQMEKVLGGNIPLPTLNEYLYGYVNGLPSSEKSKLSIANSIWFRDGFTVNPDFLQKNADYYDAAAYKSPFNDKTVTDINNWVDKNTDGMIDSILDSIPGGAVMYLINAMAFDAEWNRIYNESDIINGDFTNINGAKQNVEFMYSKEHSYLNDGKATGFIKPYEGNKYSFVALLPNEGITVDEYLQSMTGESFLNTIRNAKSTNVFASLPKFEYDYSILMNDALQTLGMTDAFTECADFSKMTPYDVLINRVIHKTFISVDERGTRAGAITAVEGNATSIPMGEYVRLDRPFVYAIIDNATNLPVFIGTVMTID